MYRLFLAIILRITQGNNYLHRIYVLLSIISNVNMIEIEQQHMCRFSVNMYTAHENDGV